MPPYDTHPALGHPEVAAWALGALDAPEAEAFGAHLASCSECQGPVAEFEAVTRALEHAVPADEPPSDLQVRTVAAVQYAAMTAAQAAHPPRNRHPVPSRRGRDQLPARAAGHPHL